MAHSLTLDSACMAIVGEDDIASKNTDISNMYMYMYGVHTLHMYNVVQATELHVHVCIYTRIHIHVPA